MPVSVIFDPEAELDLLEAYSWYQNLGTGLGEAFLSAVDASVERLRRWPQMYPVIFGVHRRVLTRRFPYAIFYEHTGEQVTI